MPPERWLTTVLFLDMVCSTERVVELGDRRWRTLLEKFHDRVRRALSACDGREVTSAGDGFLARFAAPEQAILCACVIRDLVRELGIELRSGLHVGEVERVGKTVGGIGVHIGARVAGLARPGEVLVSQTVRDAVEGSGVTFEDRGSHRLRGVPGEWRLYAVVGVPQEAVDRAARAARRTRFRPAKGVLGRVVLAAAGAALLVVLYMLLRTSPPDDSTIDTPPPRDSVAPPPPPPSDPAAIAAPGVAVLPFEVAGPALDVWREGMVHVLTTALDDVDSLRAIDKGTVMARWREAVHGEGPTDLETALSVAHRTGARYAVKGSMLAVGTAVQLAAQIYDLQDDQELGQASVNGPPDSILGGLGDRLAIEILRTIGGGEIPQLRLSQIRPRSLAAMSAYLDGEALFRSSNFEGAIRAYQRAVDADTTYALALSRLAMAYGWVDKISSRDLLTTLARLERHMDRLTERDSLMIVGGLAFARGDLQAIELLEHLRRRYPDDPEAWNLLGDAYYHLSGPALASEDVVDEAFSHALQLDSSFTPAYIHLIEDAFHRADSTRVAELVRTYGRFAPGRRFDRRNRLARDLTFGDSAARSAALALVGKVDAEVLKDLVPNLRNLRFLDVQAEVLARISRRRDHPEPDSLMVIYAFNNEARRGHLGAALRLLADPRAPAWFRSEGAYVLRALGMEAPTGGEAGGARGSRGDDGASRPTGPTVAAAAGATGVAAFYSGAMAVERSDGAAASSAVRELQSEAEQAQRRTPADLLAARFLAGAADGLEGYARWKRNRDPRAIPLLNAARQTTTGLDLRQVDVNATIRWWLGAIEADSGRPDQAERYWSSLERDAFSIWQHPLVTYRLGQAYEKLGQRERAQAAYALVLDAWRDADPSLQSLVEEARAAASRLTLAEPR